MANDRMKQKKQKARELRNKQQVIERRQKFQKEEKAINDFRKMQKHFKKKEKERQRLEAWAEQFMSKMPPELRSKLESSLAELSGMEEEYEQESNARRELNKKLEELGATSLEEKVEKMKAIFASKHQQTDDEIRSVEECHAAPGLVADTSFRPQS